MWGYSYTVNFYGYSTSDIYWIFHLQLICCENASLDCKTGIFFDDAQRITDDNDFEALNLRLQNSVVYLIRQFHVHFE